jgi:hypothetical protein
MTTTTGKSLPYQAHALSWPRRRHRRYHLQLPKTQLRIGHQQKSK